MQAYLDPVLVRQRRPNMMRLRDRRLVGFENDLKYKVSLSADAIAISQTNLGLVGVDVHAAHD